MIIIGHDLVAFKPFYEIKNSDEIAKTPPNSTVIFEFEGNENIIKFCQKNGINFAVETDSSKEALLANAAGASYIILSVDVVAQDIQDLAEHYLFDAKILLKIDYENEIMDAAEYGIDGVLLPQGVISGNF
ncbi:MAG: hypothetical protein LBJ88_05725 [Campylobacteraceae bacterium]|nr:hypothetical protein [Campylobacteraceae bacterium]